MNYIFSFIKIIIYLDIYILFFFKNLIYNNFINLKSYINIKLLVIEEYFLNFLLLIILKLEKFIIIYFVKGNFKMKYLYYKFNIKKFLMLYLYRISVNSKLKAPSLNIYYPIESSLFSITLRITGIFVVLTFLILYLYFIVFVFINYLLIL
jgi:hypothetical protein